jgi:hypothetical protein
MIRQKKREPHASNVDDPVLAMLGVGMHLWSDEPGDRFIERLRSEEEPPTSAGDAGSSAVAGQGIENTIWGRLLAHQGDEFRTATGLPFRYSVEGGGIWFFREERRINRKLARSQVETAIARCPLSSTTEIKDLMDYPYLFALLRDARIRGDFW